MKKNLTNLKGEEISENIQPANSAQIKVALMEPAIFVNAFMIAPVGNNYRITFLERIKTKKDATLDLENNIEETINHRFNMVFEKNIAFALIDILQNALKTDNIKKGDF